MKFTKITIIVFSIIICSQFILGLGSLGIQEERIFHSMFKREKTNLDFRWSDFHASFKSAEQYLIDNFRYRMDLIKFYSNLNYNLNTSISPNRVILGKDGWFFLGNNSNRVIDKFTGKAAITNGRITVLNRRFTKAQRELEKKGIKFVIVIVPNKHTAYSEKMPDAFTQVAKSDIDKMLEIKHLNIIDLRPTLMDEKAKNENLLYYPTDSHWSEYGAFLGYKQICNYLELKKNQIVSVKDKHFELRPFPQGYGLTRLLGLKVTDYKQLSNDVKKILRKEMSYGELFGNKKRKKLTARYTLGNDAKISVWNPNAKNKSHVLLLGDSFKNRLFDYFNGSFKKVSYMHWLKSEAANLLETVNVVKPNIVVYQMVERNIDNDGHLKLINRK